MPFDTSLLCFYSVLANKASDYDLASHAGLATGRECILIVPTLDSQAMQWKIETVLVSDEVSKLAI